MLSGFSSGNYCFGIVTSENVMRCYSKLLFGSLNFIPNFHFGHGQAIAVCQCSSSVAPFLPVAFKPQGTQQRCKGMRPWDAITKYHSLSGSLDLLQQMEYVHKWGEFSVPGVIGSFFSIYSTA